MKSINLTSTTVVLFLIAIFACIGGRIATAQDAPPPAESAVAETPTGASLEGSDATEPDKSTRSLDLSSPRATMREFLVAMQDAGTDRSERVEDAVACLDLSEVTGDDRIERARLLARRLYAIIDVVGVTLGDLPNQTDQITYTFHQIEANGLPSTALAIRLARDHRSGEWRFSASTIAAIPDLEKAVQKEASPAASPESTVPAGRRSPRATVTTFLDAMRHDTRNLAVAVECLNPTGQDREAWVVRGPDLAIKLKNVVDKIKVVVRAEIPDATDGPPHTWYTCETGNIEIARVVEPDPEGRWALVRGEWRFTPRTLETLDALYLSFEDAAIVPELAEAGVEEDLTFGLRLQRRMPQALRGQFLSLEGWQWVALAAFLLIGWLVAAVVPVIASLLMWSALRRRKIDIHHDVYRRALRSSGWLAVVALWLFAARHLLLPADLLAILLPILRFAMAIVGVWVGYRMVDVVGGHIAANKDIRLTHFDDVLIPLLRRILQVVVAVVVLLVVLETMGQPPRTVLGALGIGGVAVALAAKDTIGNFFGSLTVLFDRPFGVGDWIAVAGVDGTVEHVGFRSTRIRTFYNSVITIPNSKMVDTLVDNYGARRYRRAKVMISITYSTPPDKIDAFCEGIRELIRLHQYTRKDYYHVYFNQFAPASLDILLYVFFEVPDWSTELRERHRLFVDIKRLAHRLGVEFAFPTQTLYMARHRELEDRLPLTPGENDPEITGQNEAAQLFTEAYGETPDFRPPVAVESSPKSAQRRASNGDA